MPRAHDRLSDSEFHAKADAVLSTIEAVLDGWLQQDELGIWNSPSGAKVAWFKDLDGNVLSVSQH